MEHVHVEERVENSRSWTYYCKECGQHLGTEDKPPVYSAFVRDWEGSWRVLWAPDFDTPEEAQAWIDKHSPWDEGTPRVEEVYNY